MMSTNNVLSPANGKPIIVPTQDIILGLYYISMELEGERGEGMMFSDMGEIMHALDAKIVSLHAKIKARYWTVDENGEPVRTVVETTPGRMLMAEVMPKHHMVPFSTINKVMTKKEITNVIDVIYRYCGQKETVIFCDRMMQIGFFNAFKAGISFGKDDMVIPASKPKLINDAKNKVKEFEQQYQDGLITKGEKYNKVVDVWSSCSEKVAEEMMKGVQKIERGKPVNSIYMMAHSGARGSAAQIRQLAGMRGLMAKPSGEIIETPIISNFKEGLSVLEYFNSTHGARKGLADTALKTANSGYLTRRLVDVAQDAVVAELDCGTKKGLELRAVIDGGDVVLGLAERILGRTANENIKNPVTGEVIVKRNELIGEVEAEEIEQSGVDMVPVRSPLTCEAKFGICAHCYGRDLARGTPVNVGEAVGVIAAQSIGEPGTQLTMRTFHIGGAAQRGAEQSSIEAAFEGKIQIRSRNVVMTSEGTPIVMGRNVELAILDGNGIERARHKLPHGAKLLADEGAKVKPGQKLAEWDPYTTPIINEKEGTAVYVDLVEGVSVREQMDESTGISSKVVIDFRQTTRGADLKPRIEIRGKNGKVLKLANGVDAIYYLAVDAILSVENGVEVGAGEILSRIPRETSKTRDITGGLPRVAELFEARKPKDAAVIAEIDGRIEFGKDYKAKRRVIIVPTEAKESPREYMIPKGKHLIVQEGDFVQQGEPLIGGNPVPHDILAVKGVAALAEYLINEVQDVYRLQGVKINDKHIEVIVRQMLQKFEIVESGDTLLMAGEHIDKIDLQEANDSAKAEGGKPAKVVPVLQGITKASLLTRSFISAASFQETTRVLTEAATAGKTDALEGLKENVIVGRLIPAGTGAVVNRLKKIAAERDKSLAAELASRQPQLEAPAETEAESDAA